MNLYPAIKIRNSEYKLRLFSYEFEIFSFFRYQNAASDLYRCTGAAKKKLTNSCRTNLAQKMKEPTARVPEYKDRVDTGRPATPLTTHQCYTPV